MYQRCCIIWNCNNCILCHSHDKSPLPIETWHRNIYQSYICFSFRVTHCCPCTAPYRRMNECHSLCHKMPVYLELSYNDLKEPKSIIFIIFTIVMWRLLEEYFHASGPAGYFVCLRIRMTAARHKTIVTFKTINSNNIQEWADCYYY